MNGFVIVSVAIDVAIAIVTDAAIDVAIVTDVAIDVAIATNAAIAIAIALATANIFSSDLSWCS